jgi:polysaccharide pyruvyl transferase WcaK-like protein
LSYHYKLDDYMVSIGLENLVLRIDDFEPDQLATLIRRCIEQRRTLGEQVLSSHSSVRKQAQGNWDLLETIATC